MKVAIRCLAVFLPLVATADVQCATSPVTEPLVLEASPVHADIFIFRGNSAATSRANRGFVSNAGFVVTGDGVVVFDALGSPVLGAAMIHAIRKVSREPIRRLIISHYHADHFYGAQSFKNIGAEISASQRGREYLASPVAQTRLQQRIDELGPDVNATTRLTEADRWLEFDRSGEMRFAMGRYHFRLMKAPGHSHDGIMMMVEEAAVLFAGDAIFQGRVPYVADADTHVWLDTLQTIDTLGAEVVVPGHGAVTSGPAVTDPTRSYLTFLRQAMGSAAENMDDFDNTYHRIDWSQFDHWPAFEDVNRLNAYGVYMQMQNAALQRGEGSP